MRHAGIRSFRNDTPLVDGFDNEFFMPAAIKVPSLS